MADGHAIVIDYEGDFSTRFETQDSLLLMQIKGVKFLDQYKG
jgi:hypothetical protein